MLLACLSKIAYEYGLIIAYKKVDESTLYVLVANCHNMDEAAIHLLALWTEGRFPGPKDMLGKFSALSNRWRSTVGKDDGMLARIVRLIILDLLKIERLIILVVWKL